MDASDKTCYRCGEPAVSREHFPPKAFFPQKGKGLQLQTVPSCKIHNNDKSKDDQYVLAHICMNTSKNGNLAQEVFFRSIVPLLDRSPAFGAMVNEGAQWLKRGARRYKVDTERFDSFFDNLCSAIVYKNFEKPLDFGSVRVRHIYPNFHSDDKIYSKSTAGQSNWVKEFFDKNSEKVINFESDHISETVYAYKMIAPLGPFASITLAHSFYGFFNVVSMLTNLEFQKALGLGGGKRPS